MIRVLTPPWKTILFCWQFFCYQGNCFYYYILYCQYASIWLRYGLHSHDMSLYFHLGTVELNRLQWPGNSKVKTGNENTHMVLTIYYIWSLCSSTLNYLAFQYFNFERTWWRLFHKRVVCIKFDIYVFIHHIPET